MIRPLEKIADPLIPELLSRLRERAASYLSDWAASDHPLARHVPRHFELESWGLIAHWTLPLSRRGLRTAVAFDVVQKG